MSHGTNKGTIRQQRRCKAVGPTSLPPPLSPPSLEARQGCCTGLIQAIGCWRLRTPKRNSSGTWSGSHSPGMCHHWLWPSGCYCNKDMTVIEEKKLAQGQTKTHHNKLCLFGRSIPTVTHMNDVIFPVCCLGV